MMWYNKIFLNLLQQMVLYGILGNEPVENFYSKMPLSSLSAPMIVKRVLLFCLLPLRVTCDLFMIL